MPDKKSGAADKPMTAEEAREAGMTDEEIAESNADPKSAGAEIPPAKKESSTLSDDAKGTPGYEEGEPGGKYEVDGVIVDANGEPLEGEEAAAPAK